MSDSGRSVLVRRLLVWSGGNASALKLRHGAKGEHEACSLVVTKAVYGVLRGPNRGSGVNGLGPRLA